MDMCDHTNTVMPCLCEQIACIAEHVGLVHGETSLCGDGVSAMLLENKCYSFVCTDMSCHLW